MKTKLMDAEVIITLILCGRAFGTGPIVTYSTKLGKSHLDFNVRWIHDFDVSKRVEGDGFNFTASLKF